MKRVKFIKLLGLMILLGVASSCKNDNEKSLQQFIIEQQERNNIISFDIPSSLLSLNENMQAPEDIETLKSIKKASILAFKIADFDKETYLSDKKRFKTILKQKKYAELMRFGNASNGARIHMIGDEDAVDEFIVYANDDKLGWLLVRVLGKNMKPEDIMSMAQKLNLDKGNTDFNQLNDFLKGMDF